MGYDGKKLKELRKGANLTVEEVSKMLVEKGFKASTSTIYSWENNNSEPPPGALIAMCVAYNVTDFAAAFGYDGYNEDGSIRFNVEEIELVEGYRKLSKEQQEFLSHVLKRELSVSARDSPAQNSPPAPPAPPAPDPPDRLTRIPYFRKLAAAGNDFDLLNNILTGETVEADLTPYHCKPNFAVGVLGDSMEPTYYDGDIVLVRRQTDIPIGKIGLFQIENNVYIKEKGREGLVSHNKGYDIIRGYERTVCLGLVVGKV